MRPCNRHCWVSEAVPGKPVAPAAKGWAGESWPNHLGAAGVADEGTVEGTVALAELLLSGCTRVRPLF